MPRPPQSGADTVFRAFADQTRLRILHLLKGGELCVNDLVDILSVPQPTASRHLAHLRRARLVVTRRKGPWTFYALAPATSPLQGKLLGCLAQCFDEVPEIRQDAARAARVRRKGGCCPRTS